MHSFQSDLGTASTRSLPGVLILASDKPGTTQHGWSHFCPDHFVSPRLLLGTDQGKLTKPTQGNHGGYTAQGLQTCQAGSLKPWIFPLTSCHLSSPCGFYGPSSFRHLRVPLWPVHFDSLWTHPTAVSTLAFLQKEENGWCGTFSPVPHTHHGVFTVGSSAWSFLICLHAYSMPHTP
jgi:hypothetical protein